MAATRTFLSDHVRPETTGRTAFHARVAANVLAVVGAGAPARGAARLATVSLDGLDRRRRGAEPAISTRALDGRWDEGWRSSAAGVRDRLLVANPGSWPFRLSNGAS